jgi:hypothetical protein
MFVEAIMLCNQSTINIIKTVLVYNIINMKKGIAKLVHLVVSNQKCIVSTSNFNSFVNKIPCDYS